uniref:Protein kinase domain-containing protein n=1 Tax=Oryza punctata TaxID=4537 RepID=A0A0E0LZ65_ORYPU
MWRLKQFMPREQPSGLEGRTVDVGNVRVHVREPVAEGGFSCVYLARDAANPAKQYALKHVVIQDEESLHLVRKEITVMRSLKGHPNVVALVAHAVLDMGGRAREALLVMEFCEKSLVAALESRGTGHFDEQQVALIFRDVCNAVFAMHCQTPPIAHRDLKAENVLLGGDGTWKLCDFGSVSTNHKCFDKPEEMGIEEDNIRKHTTPACRAPEMWDLYRREVISEKVDIWALGCLLYRICYLKSAFDGESKLQILNGNYRIPELPKCGSVSMNCFRWSFKRIYLMDLHLDQLLSCILLRMKKDSTPSRGTISPSTNNTRSTPSENPSKLRSEGLSKAAESKGSMGAFWSTQHAQELAFVDDKGSAFDQETVHQVSSKQLQSKNHNTPTHNTYRQSLSASVDSSPGDFEIRFSPNGSEYGLEKTKETKTENKTNVQATNFNSFVADFDNLKVNFQNNVSSLNATRRLKEQQLEAEVTLLKEQLKIANLEKEEISLKFDKLSAICSSQRREIQELKQALAKASATQPVKEFKENSKAELSPPSTSLDTPPREKIEGTPPELRQGLFTSSPGTPSPDPKPWSAFPEEPKAQAAVTVKGAHPRSVRTLRASNSNKASSLGQSNTSSSADPFAFGQDNFKAAPSRAVPSKMSNLGNGAQSSKMSNLGNGSQSLNALKAEAKQDSSYQPAGWTGF